MGTNESEQTPRAAVYARLSLDSEGTGAAVERQQADCEALAEAEGLRVVEVLVDNDVSAYSGKARPAFDRLLDLAERGEVDVVVVWAVDRLYRRVADLGRVVAACKPYNVQVRAVKSGRIDLSTADGRLHAGLLAEVAEHESAKKGERMAARWEQRATREGRTTTAWLPFGWQWVDPCPAGEDCDHHPNRCEVPGVLPRYRTRKGMQPDPVAAAALRWAASFVADGGSLSAATERLRAQGFTGSKGAPLSPTALRNSMLSPRSVGLATLGGEVVGESAEGAILDRELWERVRAIMTDPRRRSPVGAPAHNLLTGTLRCPEGHPMQASNRHNRSGSVTRIYKCGKCSVNRRTVLAERPVVELVAEVLTRWADQLLAVAAPTAGPAQVKAAREVADLRQRLETLAALMASGDLDPADYAAATRAVRERLADAEGRSARIAGLPSTAALMRDARGPAAAWRHAVEHDVDTARAVLRELVERVDLKPPAVPRRPADTDLDVTLAEWLRELAADRQGVAS